VSDAPFKAFDCIFDRVEDAKDAVDAGMLQIEHRSRGHSGQAHISVPLDCAFQTAEKEVQGVPVHLTNMRAIEHDAGPLHVHTAFEFAKEEPAALDIELFRNVFDGNSTSTK
jgi:hypothetical protein